MKPLKPEEFAQVGGAAPLRTDDPIGINPDPLPVVPLDADSEINQPK